MKFTYSSGERPLEGYTIKRGIGRGGFGEVYYATSDAGKEVALKRIFQNAEIELRGITQCLNLKHAGLVHLFDLRKDGQGEHWVVMEYVAGESLGGILARNACGIGVELARQWFAGLGAAVGYLHDNGIVHRDLKPANIFIENGVVKVGDYGLSKFIAGSDASPQTRSIGTVHYMAPEISNGNYNRQVDIYAAGIILYEMLSGRVPFDGQSAGEILMKHMTLAPDLTAVPSSFVPILHKALAKNAANRYRTMGEMVKDVQRTEAIDSSSKGVDGASAPGSSASSLADTLVAPPVVSPARKLAELAGALVLSACLAAMLGLVWEFVVHPGDARTVTEFVAIATACSWCVLIPAKIWSGPADESWSRRLIMTAVGLALGIGAFWLHGGPLYDALSNPSSEGRAEAVKYLAFFGLAFFLMRWWKLAERPRPVRFDFGAVLVTGILVYVLSFLLSPQANRSVIVLGLVAAAAIVQLVSPWEKPLPRPAQRNRLRFF